MGGRLQGKVAVVTGAGRGIGQATASLFASQGAVVVIAERDEVVGRQVADDLVAQGARAVFVRTDVTDQASVDDLVKQTSSAFGRIDVLINNAGINVFREPLTCSDVDWASCFSVDLEGVWRCAKAVLPGMLDQGAGAIVNIASIHAFSIIPGSFPYPVAKHAVVGLTRALGVEYAGRGIRVNAIAPGYIETDLVKDYFAGFADPAGERRRIEALHPARRIGRPDEVAQTALFLASDEAPFINAQCIVIDGGRLALNHD